MFSNRALSKENRKTIRFNDYQENRIKKAAEKLEMSEAEFIRHAADLLAKEVTGNNSKLEAVA